MRFEREMLALCRRGQSIPWNLEATVSLEKKMPDMVLDFVKDIRINPHEPRLLHSHLIESHRLALHHLASQVRSAEQAHIDANIWPSVGREEIPDFVYWEPVTFCSFNWFAISLTSYLRLIALVDVCNRYSWTLDDLVANSKAVNKECEEYVRGIVPAVLKWRNKVAAHPAATSPIGKGHSRLDADNLATLLQSYSCPVSRVAGYFEVGRMKWKIDGEVSDLQPWSLTSVYEALTPRFWPDTAIKPHRHRPGSEPSMEPGTHLWLVTRPPY